MGELSVFETYINGDMEIDVARNDTLEAIDALDRMTVEVEMAAASLSRFGDLLNGIEFDEGEC